MNERQTKGSADLRSRDQADQQLGSGTTCSATDDAETDAPATADEEVAAKPAEAAADPLADTEWHYLCDRRGHLRVHVLANRLYQQERQRVFELREGMVKVVSLVAGSVAFVRVADPQMLQVCSAVLVIATSAALVFGWGAKARDAAKRCADWTGLDRDIARTGERHFEERDLDEWQARCCEVESNEPAPNLVLWERSYGRACSSLGRNADKDGAPWGTRWRPPFLIP